MTIAVLSDIHGNYLALEACLAYAESRGVEGYVFLGDYISDNACPERTMEVLYEWARRHDCRFIRGNREEYMVDYRDGKIAGWQDGSGTGSLLYTYEHLTDRDIDWFRTLDNHGSEGFSDAPPLYYCHGSPWKTAGSLQQGDPETVEGLRAIAEPCILCGHTHRMGMFLLPQKTAEPIQVIRAGSVGYPLSTPGRAQMVFLHSVAGSMPRWRPEYILVPYDNRAAVQGLYDSGLMERAPVWSAMTAHALLTGENIAGLLPPFAQRLYEKACGKKAAYSDIPEEYWQKAARAYPCETRMDCQYKCHMV